MRKKLLISFMFFFVFWFGFLGLSGTLTSGFHLTDDHQIIYFVDKVNEGGAVNTGVKWIGEDIGKYGRFLPAYYMHRMFQIKFFASDFFLWGAYNALLTASASFLYSAAFLLLGFTLFEALIFPLFLYLGLQSAIIWRFGTAETIGLPILSVMLLLIALSALQRSLFKDALFIAAGVVLMLTKESFLVFIPAVLFLKIWLEQKYRQKGWVETAKQNAFPITVLLASVAAMVLFIKFYMKTMGIGYAGYYGFQTGPVVSALKTYIVVTQAWLIPAGVAFAWATWPGKVRRLAAEILPLLVFFALALVPESLLHARSGVYERYILPGAFGTVFAVMYLLKLVRENTEKSADSRRAGWAVALLLVFAGAHVMKLGGNIFTSYNIATAGWDASGSLSNLVSWLHGPLGRALSHAAVLALLLFSAVPLKSLGLRRPGQKTFFAILLVWAVVFNFSMAYDNASRAAFDGHMTNDWLATIKENTGKDDAIIVVADPALNFEWAFSVKRYMNLESGRQNVFTYPVLTKNHYDPFQKELIGKFSGLYKEYVFRGQKDPKAIKAFAIFPGAEKQFLTDAASWFDSGAFARYENGYGYVSYYMPPPR